MKKLIIAAAAAAAVVLLSISINANASGFYLIPHNGNGNMQAPIQPNIGNRYNNNQGYGNNNNRYQNQHVNRPSQRQRNWERQVAPTPTYR